MPSNGRKVPSYCRHKHSGQAVVRVGGHDHYLGQYGSPQSHEGYERLISAWRSGRLESTVASKVSNAVDLSINELILAFWRYAEIHYVKDGQPTGELDNLRASLPPLRRLFGHSPASDFGPKALKSVREEMISSGNCRNYINSSINRIKRVFRWGVSEELVAPSIYEALRAVPGLRAGRTRARESAPVRSIPVRVVEATLAQLSPVVGAMVRFQLLTGCRPQEVRR